MIEFERLETLAYVLDNVPPERFDLEFWQCGTSACAVGWAMQTPCFQKAGLETGIDDRMPELHYPVYQGHSGFLGVSEFFGTSVEDTEDLFACDSYESEGLTKPEEVATRIRAFILEKKLETCPDIEHAWVDELLELNPCEKDSETPSSVASS